MKAGGYKNTAGFYYFVISELNKSYLGFSTYYVPFPKRS